MRLAVLGTMVWDRIDHPDAPTVERWGGISYSLAAAAAAAPDDWVLRPLIRVGGDLVGPARTFLDTLPLESAGVVETAEPNNRVHLRYRDREHRQECLTGGVGPWPTEELLPLLEGVDALYINLISGFELTLETARAVRAAFEGPVYADLHSLLLGVGADGHRVPRPLARRSDWLTAFDVVQVNERELALVAGDDPAWEVAEEAVRNGLSALFVTRGPEGAAAVAAGEDQSILDRGANERAEVARVEVPVRSPSRAGDPTGCGDVWGATCFIDLLRGATPRSAMEAANAAAARNADHRGAEGLFGHLRTLP